MVGEWRDCEWGDIATLEYGKSLREYDDARGHFRVYGTNGPIGWHDSVLCRHPGVIVGRKGAYRGIHYSPEPFFVIDTAFFLEPKEKLDLRWAYYSLLTCDINGMDSGSAIPSTSRESFYRLPVRVPPIDEQRAIAHILGTLDDKIELNRRMNETLEAMTRALFRAVTENVGGMRTVGEIAEINSWTLGNNDELNPIEYVEISEVSRGSVAKVQVFQRGEEPSRARRRLRHGDTVLSTVRPERGSYFLCLHPSPNLIASTGFAVITPRKAPWSYVHAALTQPEVFEQLGQLADGGAYPAIRPEVIAQWEILWPDDVAVLEEFHRRCATLYERIEQNRRESYTLATLRDTLLPKLIPGELRVKEA